MFSCLPFLTGREDISVDLYENLFLKYFRKAPFVQRGCKFTELYRVYSYDVFCNEHQNFELLNYMLLKYNAAPDLNVQSYDCFSLYENTDREEVVSSKCFENKQFQLIMTYGNGPEAHIQFYLHVAYDVFSMFENCIEEEFGDDDLFTTTDHDHFLLKLLSRKQLASMIVLSLTAESILRILLRMYSGMMAYSDVQAYVFATCYKPSVFINWQIIRL